MVQYAVNGTELTVRISGELDHHSSVEIRESIDKLIDKYPKARKLQFDVSELTFMDSSGIGVVIGRYRRMSGRGGVVCVKGASGRVDKIFKLSGLYQIIEKA